MIQLGRNQDRERMLSKPIYVMLFEVCDGEEIMKTIMG